MDFTWTNWIRLNFIGLGWIQCISNYFKKCCRNKLSGQSVWSVTHDQKGTTEQFALVLFVSSHSPYERSRSQGQPCLRGGRHAVQWLWGPCCWQKRVPANMPMLPIPAPAKCDMLIQVFGPLPTVLSLIIPSTSCLHWSTETRCVFFFVVWVMTKMASVFLCQDMASEVKSIYTGSWKRAWTKRTAVCQCFCTHCAKSSQLEVAKLHNVAIDGIWWPLPKFAENNPSIAGFE